jgi:predicted nucleic acid-binding protein
MAILIDTNFLLAAIFVKDKNHPQAAKAIQSLDTAECVVPLPVMQELFYMTSARLNYKTAIEYCEQVHEAGFSIPEIVDSDFSRAF